MVVVPSTLTTLTEYAQAVLLVAENALADTAEGSPVRSYVSPAAPTFDCCPQLTVHVNGLFEAPTSPLSPTEATALRTKFGNVILATYVTTAIRCAPVPNSKGNPPSAEEIGDVAVIVTEDGWALWNGFRNAIACDELFEDCLGVHFDGGVPIREQGGCVGWQFTIRAHIPGIIVECAS